MDKIKWLMKHFEEILAGILLVLIVLVVTANITTRALGIALVWADELSRYLFIWFIFLGVVIAWKRKGHIALDYFIELLPTKYRKIVNFLNRLGMLLLICVIFYFSLTFTIQAWSTPSTSLQLPMGLVYFSVTLSMGLIIIYSVIDIIRAFYKKENIDF